MRARDRDERLVGRPEHARGPSVHDGPGDVSSARLALDIGVRTADRTGGEGDGVVDRLVGLEAMRPKPETSTTVLGLAYPFPNYAIALMPQSAFWYEVHPLGPGRIDLTSHILLPPHLLDEPGLEERVAEHRVTFAGIHEQDIVVCEGVQRGLASSTARPGMLSRLEEHNRGFARWYARHLT